MKWGAEADAKLLLGILKVHAIKLDYNELAKYMGSDCTPKALTHRIANLKKAGANFEPASSAPATPRKRGAPKSASDGGRTPKSARKAAPKKTTIKREATPDSLHSDDDEHGGIPAEKHITPRRSATSRVNYAESASTSTSVAGDVEEGIGADGGAHAAVAGNGDVGDENKGVGSAVKLEPMDDGQEDDPENQLLTEAFPQNAV